MGFKVGDIVTGTNSENWNYNIEGVVTLIEDRGYKVCFEGNETSTVTWYESELKLVHNKPEKFLVYNATSQKSVGIMSEVSALKHAASTPNCEFQLYELRYNIVPKPVEVTYELQEVGQ